MRGYPKNFDHNIGDFWFSADDPCIPEFIERYRAALGYEPFSYRVGKYTRGREDEHPFYFFPHPVSAKLEVADGIVYENQLVCGNPPPEANRVRLGCGQRKRQIASFRLGPKARLPRADFFPLWTAPRLATSRVMGISKRVRDAFVAAEISGVRIWPILDATGEAESGLYQLEITESTHGAIELSSPLRKPTHCRVCEYWFGFSPDEPTDMLTYPRSYFADRDFQIGDRLRVRGEPEAFFGSDSAPPIFATAHVIRLVREMGFKGLTRGRKWLQYWPVSIEDEEFS